MTSARQQAANQRNAQKSTGPRTPEGKSVSRGNNLRHGLRAEQLLLPSESLADRAQVTEAYYEQFQPVGPVEHRHVERLVNLDWRMRRVEDLETCAFVGCVERPVQAMVDDLRSSSGLLTKVWRYDRQLDRSYQQTLKDLREMQAQRKEIEALNEEPEPQVEVQPQAMAPAKPESTQPNGLPDPQMPQTERSVTRKPIGPNLTLVTRVG